MTLSQMLKALSTIGVLLSLSSCSSNQKEAALLCGMTFFSVCVKDALTPPIKADLNCENEPQPVIPPRVRSETIAVLNDRAVAWLNPKKYPQLEGATQLTFEYLAPLLAYSKFKAVEIRAPHPSPWTVGLSWLDNATPGRWVSFSIQPRGHILCSAYEKEVRKNKTWLPGSLRNSGIKNDQCIAVEVVESPSSQFAYDVVKQPVHNRDGYPIYSWLIRDLKSNTVYAEVRRHYEPGSDCPLQAVRQQFVNVVVP